jgi:hypothetical protein
MKEYDPESELVHFKFWKVTPRNLDVEVKLRGQFDGEPIPQVLDRLEWIANPVNKTHEGKHHNSHGSNEHFLGYFLKQQTTQPMRWVKFQNQLDAQPVFWQLADPTVLLVPASKVHEGDPPEPPKTVSHFECYLVRNAPRVNAAIQLDDQFDRRLGRPEKVRTLEPAFFCVPVSKNAEEPVHPKVHLALYDLDKKVPYKATVFARDQFNLWKIEVEESIMLGVPTQKLDWGKGKAPQSGTAPAGAPQG